MAEETVRAKEIQEKKENKESKDSKCSKSKKGLIIGCIIAGIVLIAAIVTLVIINPFKKANMIGKYELVGLISDGKDQTESIPTMKAFGISLEVEITDNTKGKLTIFGENIDFTYDKDNIHFDLGSLDSDQVEVTDGFQKDTPYTFKDEKLVIKSNKSEMTFSKKKDNQ